jgi:hypothetical protein
MKKISTGLCFAAALGLTATLGAQVPTTTASGSADKDHEVTVTGCLSKAATGFMLNNAQVDTGTSTTTTAGSTSTTTAGTTGTSGTNREAGAAAAPMSWMLSGDSDLEKHVGHKIQVTGRTSWDASMDRGRTSATTASGAGTTAAPPATSTSTTTTTPGSGPRLDVKSIKMVSASCS